MKQILIAGVLAFCSFQSMAQLRIPGTVDGTGQVDGIIIGGTSIVIGTSPSTTPGNVIIGNGTGNLNTTGSNNTFVGQDAATSNTTGYANTFLGRWSGVANSVGYANTFLGQYSGHANTTANHNAFVGQGAGAATTTGGDNAFLGQAAGLDNVTGYSNTFIGKIAGDDNVSGNSNTALGYNTKFLSGSLTNATAIGANAQVGASNSLILGGTGANAVNVGIGTTTPGAHLHTVNPSYENVIFSTTSSFTNATVNLQAGVNNAYNFMNGTSYSGTYLPFVASNSAPAVPSANLAGLVTDGTPLILGVDGADKNGSIHFVNWMMNGAGFLGRAECMRVNKSNGFVGVHTRSANTASGSGEPQTLFHVNLTNPYNSNLDPLTQGIRFEGLPSAQPRHTKVIVVDPSTGDLAIDDPGSGGPIDWHINGNNINMGEFIGTLNNEDFEIYTNNARTARYTKDGNFDLGVFGSNAIINSSATSAALGQNNTLDGATSSIEAGLANTITNSQYSAAFGDGNTIDLSSVACQASGKGNGITDADYSTTSGLQNTVTLSTSVFAGGTDNQIDNSQEVLVYGDDTYVDASYASGVIGEENVMMNAHGCFIGGGHNVSDGLYNFIGGNHNEIYGRNNHTGGNYNASAGDYNFLWGNYLVGDISSSTAVPADNTDTNPYLMVIGERINSDLTRSLSVGFNGNRTTVTTERGMAVQLNPTSGSTYQPVANFEVDAALAPSPGPQPLGGMGLQSNIRFHNLPRDPQSRMLPAVLIDPNTGELFQSQNQYLRPGKDNSSQDIDSLFKENEAMKERIAQLEEQNAAIPQLQSQLALYDEKFAQLERSIGQICESGCAGLKNIGRDELYQSIPNPADNKVMINYHLSREYSNANISVYGMSGQELGSYSLSPVSGDGSVNISVAELQPGMYLYRLVVDGKPVDTKKLQKQ